VTAVGWNYGDLFDAIGRRVPERVALIHESMSRTWREVDQRSNRLARAWLASEGVEVGDKVAFLLRNGPAYIEGVIAAFKARLVHVNVNYRYVADELWYVLDGSDAAIIVYDAEFASRIDEIRARLPNARLYVEVGAATPENSYATDYEQLASEGDGSSLGIERSPDDLFFLYTGGTTGLPKGVMWRQRDRLAVYAGRDGEGSAEDFLNARLSRVPGRHLPACPLMHSTGLTSSLLVLVGGGSVVTMTGRFDAARFWDTVEEHCVQSLAIVGDAFAVPLLKELEASPKRWNLGCLRRIISAGVMWSDANKEGLLRHLPGATLVDTFGSSESSGMGQSVWRKGERQATGEFQIGERCRVFTADHREVAPGSGVPGLIAKSGPIPVGYYKDPEATAKVFPTIDGVRYTIPGDWCLVRADGTLRLLGRGNTCINSGGEKVFPEEVEETLKRHPGVEDALVVGIPDERWGQMVVGVVATPEGRPVDEVTLRNFARKYLADYKVPKRIVSTRKLGRGENGKPDYDWAQATVLQALQNEEPRP
jgi:fatty-acyl-CoA synthase